MELASKKEITRVIASITTSSWSDYALCTLHIFTI